jgi:hypothetical protein
MAHIKIKDVWKSENTRISKLKDAKFWVYTSKFLCTCRFYAKGMDIKIAKKWNKIMMMIMIIIIIITNLENETIIQWGSNHRHRVAYNGGKGGVLQLQKPPKSLKPNSKKTRFLWFTLQEKSASEFHWLHYKVVSKIFETGAAIYSVIVEARSTGKW